MLHEILQKNAIIKKGVCHIMASVNWEKVKGVDPKHKDAYKASHVIKHCSKDTRLKIRHSNPDIDISLTMSNWAIGAQTAYETEKAYHERINELDQTTNKNKRRDRCELLLLDVPAPANLKTNDRKKWFDDVYKAFCKQFGEKNIIGFQVHVDEIHEYVNYSTGKKVVSRPHAHVQVVPEQNGQLNAKAVYTKANMQQLNNAVHDMTLKNYGIKFMDGSKRKDVRDMAEIKLQSLKLENEQLTSLNTELKRTRKQLREDIAQKQSELTQIQSQINQGKDTMNALQEKLESIQKQLKVLQEEKEEYLAFRAERRKKREKQQQQMQKLSDMFGEAVNIHSYTKRNGKDNPDIS